MDDCACWEPQQEAPLKLMVRQLQQQQEQATTGAAVAAAKAIEVGSNCTGNNDFNSSQQNLLLLQQPLEDGTHGGPSLRACTETKTE